jgi:hypothetical protein
MKTKQKLTPLIASILEKKPAFVRSLLQFPNLDVNATDSQGRFAVPLIGPLCEEDEWRELCVAILRRAAPLTEEEEEEEEEEEKTEKKGKDA